MRNASKGFKIGVFVGLGLLVLINMAVFAAIFRPACSASIYNQPSAEKHVNQTNKSRTAAGTLVLKGLDFILGPASGR
jgi:hypothetical protein